MKLGQLDPNTEPAWWVKDTRVDFTAGGRIIYDPKLWWPMEMLKRIGRAWLRLRYSEAWHRNQPRPVKRGPRVPTYRNRFERRSR